MMTIKEREEIVKALECCHNRGCQEGCPRLCNNIPMEDDCRCDLIHDALTLIKELAEEIKYLEAEHDRIYEQAEADIRGNIANGGMSCHWCENKTKADTIRKMRALFEEKLDISVCGYSTEEVVSDVLETLDKVTEELLG